MALIVEQNILKVFFVILTFGYSAAVEEVVVKHAPEAIKFLSNEPVRSSYMGDIFSAMFAYTIRSRIGWLSLADVVPWKRPDAIAVVELMGFDSKVDLPLDGDKFLLENVGDLRNQYDLISHRTNERYFGKEPVMLYMDLNDKLHDAKVAQPVLLKSVPADPKKRLQMALEDPELGQLVRDSTFNISQPSDVTLLTELATIREFLKALAAHKSDVRDKIPDLYWLKISGLESVVSFYGEDSIQCKEALRLLQQVVSEVESTMRHIYDNNVVVTIIKTNSLPLVGHKSRSLLEAPMSKKQMLDARKSSQQYDPNFPTAFLMLSVVGWILFLAVFGITMVLWNIDPGRDSIIYRMTSQRMKKD